MNSALILWPELDKLWKKNGSVVDVEVMLKVQTMSNRAIAKEVSSRPQLGNNRA